MKWHVDALAFGDRWPNHTSYLRACDNAYKQLTCVSGSGEFTSDVPTVVCVARNEERRLPAFIAHYKKLGVQKLHIVDNASSDRTAEIALSFTNVTLWRTQDSYARSAFGQLWAGALVRRHGLNNWVLNLDADEFLVYGGMDTVSLGDVQAYLSATGAERLFTPLIDIYPDEVDADISVAFDDTSKCFFDGNIDDDQFSYRFEQTRFGPRLSGGPRSRMMSAIGKTEFPWLSKFAMAKWDSATAYANVHFPYPFDRNPGEAFAALLHLKLLGDFPERVASAIQDGEHFNAAAEYKSYQKWLRSDSIAALYSADHSRRYEGPQSLLDAGLIEFPPWGVAHQSRHSA